MNKLQDTETLVAYNELSRTSVVNFPWLNTNVSLALSCPSLTWS